MTDLNTDSGIGSNRDTYSYKDAIRAILDRLQYLEAECTEATSKLETDAQNQASGAIGKNQESKVKKEYAYMVQEINYFKKSVPEGLPEADSFQYFLAIAELQKRNEHLRTLEIFSEANLKHLTDQCNASRKVLEQQKTTLDMLRKSPEDQNAVSEKRAKTGDDAEALKCQEIDQEIRTTKKIYKELKEFLGEYLHAISKYEGNDPNSPLLGLLIQALWDKFFLDGPESYIKISHLDYDINPQHVDWLIKFNIIERHPEDEDMIRMIDFTA